MDLFGSLLSLLLAAMLVEYGCGQSSKSYQQQALHFVGCFKGDHCEAQNLTFGCPEHSVISVQEYTAALNVSWDGSSTCRLPSDMDCFTPITNYSIEAQCDKQQSCRLDVCRIYKNVEAVSCAPSHPNIVSVNYTCNTSSGISSTSVTDTPLESTTRGEKDSGSIIIIIAVTVSVIVVVIIVIVLVVILRKKKDTNTKDATTDQSSSTTKEPNRLSYSTHMIDNMDYQTSNDVLPNKGFHDNSDETEIMENLQYSTFTDKGCLTSSDDKRRGLGLKQVPDNTDETEIVENLEYSTFNSKESPTSSDNKRGELGLKQVPGDLSANKSFPDPFYDQISGKSAKTHGAVPGYEDVTVEQFQNTNTQNQILKQFNGFMKPQLPKKPGTIASNGINSNGGYKGLGQPSAFQISQESPNQENCDKHTSLPKEKGPLGDDYTMVVKQE